MKLMYKLSGLAGVLQVAFDDIWTGAYVSELGNNYGKYHAELAAAFTSMELQPTPSRFADDFGAYQRACADARGVIVTEVHLRTAKLLIDGKSPSDAFSVPLIDRNEQLIDFASPGSVELVGTDPAQYGRWPSTSKTAAPSSKRFEGFPDPPPLFTSIDQALSYLRAR